MASGIFDAFHFCFCSIDANFSVTPSKTPSPMHVGGTADLRRPKHHVKVGGQKNVCKYQEVLTRVTRISFMSPFNHLLLTKWNNHASMFQEKIRTQQHDPIQSWLVPTTLTLLQPSDLLVGKNRSSAHLLICRYAPRKSMGLRDA